MRIVRAGINGGHDLQLIGELRLRPGDRVPTENELAATLGISRTSAREAVKTHAIPAELRAVEVAAEICRQGHVAGRTALFEQGDDEFHLGVAVASHNQCLVAAVREARRLQRQCSATGCAARSVAMSRRLSRSTSRSTGRSGTGPGRRCPCHGRPPRQPPWRATAAR